MIDRMTIPPRIMSEIRALSDEAWAEFAASAPEGIDYIAEASLRGLMVARMRRAVARGEADRCALRESALNGL
jgi:hypothetical protein